MAAKRPRKGDDAPDIFDMQPGETNYGCEAQRIPITAAFGSQMSQGRRVLAMAQRQADKCRIPRKNRNDVDASCRRQEPMGKSSKDSEVAKLMTPMNRGRDSECLVPNDEKPTLSPTKRPRVTGTVSCVSRVRARRSAYGAGGVSSSHKTASERMRVRPQIYVRKGTRHALRQGRTSAQTTPLQTRPQQILRKSVAHIKDSSEQSASRNESRISRTDHALSILSPREPRSNISPSTVTQYQCLSRRLPLSAHLSPVSSDSEMYSKQDIRLRELTPRELERVEKVTRNVFHSDIVAQVSDANIFLRGADIRRLRGRRWLNDEVINAFAALINQRSRAFWAQGAIAASLLAQRKCTRWTGDDVVAVTPADDSCRFSGNPTIIRPRCYMFNTFFMTRLSQHGYDYSGVARWPRRAGIDICELDLILIPVNIKNFHWVLAAVDIQRRQLMYFDSMYGPDSTGVLETLRRWTRDEVADKHGEACAAGLGVEVWRKIENPDYQPRQIDDGSCGVFTLYMADCLELAKKPNHTQNDMTILRHRAVLFLLESCLPTS